MHRPTTAVAAALVALALQATATPMNAQSAARSGRAPMELVTSGQGAYASSAMRLRVSAPSEGAAELVQWETSDPAKAWVSASGTVVFLEPGRVSITARRGADTAMKTFDVRGNPAARIALTAPARARVGERVRVAATILDDRGNAVNDEAVNLAASNGATVTESGEFVAQMAGTYTVTAQAGSAAASRTIVIDGPSAVQQGEGKSPREAGTLRAARVTLTMDIRDVFVGDSLRLHASAIAAGARPVDGAHVVYGVSEPGSPDGVHAAVTADGVFVATRPGVYTIFAAIGDRADQQTLLVQQRPMR